MKPAKRLLAMLLNLALLLALFAHTASALDAVVGEAASAAQTSADVVALREENVKHFALGNGVYRAIAYSHPVHELDGNGVWQDIDFGLTLTASESGRVYANEAVGAEFAERLTANRPLFTLSDGGSSVSMTLRTAGAARTAVAAEVTNPENVFQTAEDAQNADFSSSVLYEDVLPGVDLEYVVDPGTVKENIIVKERADAYSYEFSLDLTGLSPVMQGDGSIILYAQGAEKYAIPAPFMYDALGNCSEDVSYTLGGSGNTYVLTVTANAEWLNAIDRAFPVTIDPSYIVSTEEVDDTYISSDEPTTNYGSNSMLWVRSNRITYIKTPSFSIPSYATLDSAYLTAFYYYFDYVTTGSVGVSAHRITSGWNESTLTWNTASAMADNFGLATAALDAQVTYASRGATFSDPEQIDFVITDTVRGWLNGTYPNYGIGLKYVPGSVNLSVVFRSSESSYNYRPRVTYTYHTYFYFTNYYDSTFSSANVANISKAIEVANTAYLSQFGLRMIANGTPTYRGDLADACTRGVNERCLYDVCEDYHHKDVKWISTQLLAEVQSSNQRIVYWTDRESYTYCIHEKETPDGEELCKIFDSWNGVSLAGVYGYRPVIHIMNLLPDAGDDDVDDLACMGINLIHEMAHTFGLDDRYEGYNHTDEGYQCVMEHYQYDDNVAHDFYIDILYNGKNAFCPSCAADLNSLINS